MTLEPPSPFIGLRPGEVPDQRRLEELFAGIQRNFEFFSLQFPVQGGNLGLGGQWQSAALTNSWEWYGAEHAKPAYRKGLDGRVYLRGEVKKSSGAAGTAIFTLPTGFRPTAKTINVAWSSGVTRVDVLPTGEVLYLGSASTVGDLSLDQISFYPN